MSGRLIADCSCPGGERGRARAERGRRPHGAPPMRTCRAGRPHGQHVLVADQPGDGRVDGRRTTAPARRAAVPRRPRGQRRGRRGEAPLRPGATHAPPSSSARRGPPRGRRRTRWRASASSPAAGSSSSSSGGSRARARARLTRCASPPDSDSALRSARRATPRRSRAASAVVRRVRRRLLASAAAARRSYHARGEDPRAESRSRCGGERSARRRPLAPVDLDVPGVGALEPGEQPQQCGLARAVGPSTASRSPGLSSSSSMRAPRARHGGGGGPGASGLAHEAARCCTDVSRALIVKASASRMPA